MQKIRQAVVKHLWWITAIVAVALLICHSLKLTLIAVDTTSLILLALILLSPFVAAIKRVKIGEFEAEIDPAEVKRITQEVASKVSEAQTVTLEGNHPALDSIRDLLRTDPVIALAKLRIEMERTLRRLYDRAIPNEAKPSNLPVHQLIRDLTDREILPRDLAPSIRDVLALCNRAIHGETIRERDAKAVIESGGELLAEFERALAQFGVGHPVQKGPVTQAEVEAYRAARYRVVTVIPTIPTAHRVVYVLTHDEVEDFFEGYEEFAEFVVGVEQIQEPPHATVKAIKRA